MVEDKVVGILRYHLFWDDIPFCSMLSFEQSSRGKRYGHALMQLWEKEMRDNEYEICMTSTQFDEREQFFIENSL